MTSQPLTALATAMNRRPQAVVTLADFPSPIRHTWPWDTDWRQLHDHLVYLILGNACILQYHQETIRLESGTWFCCPPALPFRLALADEGSSTLIERFRFTLTTPDANLTLLDTPLIIPDAGSLGPLMTQVIQEAESTAIDSPLRLQAHLTLLLSEAFRLAERNTTTGALLSPGQKSHLRLFVRRRLPHWPTPADLARELHLSSDYFARLFRRSMGMSPRAWLVDERIRCAAASLLETDAAIGKVAHDHGYQDLTLFGRQFRAIMGAAPRQWREQHRTFDAREVG